MAHSRLHHHIPRHTIGDNENLSELGRVGQWYYVWDDEKKVHHGHEYQGHGHDGQLGRHGRHHAHAYVHGPHAHVSLHMLFV